MTFAIKAVHYAGNLYEVRVALLNAKGKKVNGIVSYVPLAEIGGKVDELIADLLRHSD